MNNEKIEVSAKSVDAAVKKGLEKLGLEKDQAEWEVLQEAGFLRHWQNFDREKTYSGEPCARICRENAGAHGL